MSDNNNDNGIISSDKYGNMEVNNIEHAGYDVRGFSPKEVVQLDDKRIDKVLRIRLVTDPGFGQFDVSYCHALLKDGTPVRVSIPPLPAKGTSESAARQAIVQYCKQIGVYAKGIGILDVISISPL